MKNVLDFCICVLNRYNHNKIIYKGLLTDFAIEKALNKEHNKQNSEQYDKLI